MKLSIVILTYNREPLVVRLVHQLLALGGIDQIVLVDNAASRSLAQYTSQFPLVDYVEGDNAKGVYSRSLGMSKAIGDIIVCLDDDIFGLSGEGLAALRRLFQAYPAVGAICFKVLDLEGAISNWCHHCNPTLYSEKQFNTYEISEGAVAFRKDVLAQTGLYPEGFFISHEGLDLALRIIDRGYEIIFSPEIAVEHHHAQVGRKSWRRYYYDTRNLFLIWMRHFAIGYGAMYAIQGLGAMFVYSARDGFLGYYFRGVRDGAVAAYKQRGDRRVIGRNTVKYIRNCRRNKFDVGYIVRSRLLKRTIRI